MFILFYRCVIFTMGNKNHNKIALLHYFGCPTGLTQKSPHFLHIFRPTTGDFLPLFGRNLCNGKCRNFVVIVVCKFSLIFRS